MRWRSFPVTEEEGEQSQRPLEVKRGRDPDSGQVPSPWDVGFRPGKTGKQEGLYKIRYE